MTTTRVLLALGFGAMLLAGCDRRAGNDVADGTNAAAPPPAAANEASPAPARDEQAPARVYTLAGNGLEPGLPFGTPKSEAVAAGTAAFGPPTGEDHVEECGEGPMDFVRFRGLSLGFQDGRFAGWSLGEPMPALRSAQGLAVGAPRSVLGAAEIDRESTLGPEFHVGGIGGLLDEREREVATLWAGFPCHFR